MFDRIAAAFVDALRRFIISDDGDGGGGISSSTSFVDDPSAAPQQSTTSLLGGDGVVEVERRPDIFRYYLPILIILFFSWPILLTLIAASISASAWLFWLAVGSAFGLLQLIYVLYNFAMIIWDVSALTLLKTFAMLRSVVRHYYYKFGRSFVGGISSSVGGDRHRGDGNNRRRREWRVELDNAREYDGYTNIELLEPPPRRAKVDRTTSGDYRGRRTNNAMMSHSSLRRTISVGSTKDSESASGDRMRRPRAIDLATPAVIGGNVSPVRKIQSSRDFNETLARSTSTSSGGSGGGGPDVGLRRRSGGGGVFRRHHSPQTSDRIDNLDHRGEEARESSSTSSTSRVSPLRRVRSSALPLNDKSNDVDEYYDRHDDNDDPNDDGDDGGDDDDEWHRRVVKEDLGMTGEMILTTLDRLREAREQASFCSNRIINDRGNTIENNNSSSGGGACNSNDQDSHSSSLKTLLSGIVKRNHLSVDDALMEDARSVAERGQHSLMRETRDTIDMYGEEVERCIDYLACGPVHLGGGGGGCVGNETPSSSSDADHRTTNHGGDGPNNDNSPERIMQKQRDELARRYTLFRRMKQNMGHTALMLSGGGAQAMYHLGTIKALVESKLYEHIHVISGTSGGSIVAAMCAIKTPDELLRDICVNTVSTDYMLTGEMKRLGVSWFPSLYRMGADWMKSGLVMDSKEFFRCCEFYYSNITFEEAYEMTGKHVCITVSASRAYAGSGVQRLLLNHISTPNVTLASAVAASCALPGVMSPTKLMIKDDRGEQVPFEVDGVEWIDGSVQADLPFKRISTLFNISNFVVAQTNFHVVPFLNKAHHPNVTTLYWKLFQMCMWDVKSRVLNLSQLGLFPKIFGQDLTKVFTQKYYGKLTLVPRFTTLQIFGLKVLSNPTVKDMDNYLQNGQLAAWPFLRVLKEMLRIERSIDAGLARLDQRLKSVASGYDSTLPNDDVDSLSSANYRARLPGLGREAELLKVEVRSLRQENKILRQQVARLQRSMGISHANPIGPILEGRLISVSTVAEAVE